MLLAIAPLSLSLGFFKVPQDKVNEKMMKSASNEELGFVCANFRFRVSGRAGGVLAGVGRYLILMITSGSGS
jgi:hypothetical protein